jgi:hypothetical protein
MSATEDERSPFNGSENGRLDSYGLLRLIVGDCIDPCFPNFSLETLLDRVEKIDHIDRQKF